jgi:hypothetical protein
MAAGYSPRSLIEKLGLREGVQACLLSVPATVEPLLAPLPEGVRVARRLQGSRDFILLFVSSTGELERRLPRAYELLDPDGMLWIAWPKKSSGLATDLSFDLVQGAGLATGLVDVKVCAVDEQWSGLKFMVRKADRQELRRRRGAAGS